MTKILPKDGAPEGYKNLPKATADEDDVEGHQKLLPRDGAPEGYKNLPKATGDQDDEAVEGHRK